MITLAFLNYIRIFIETEVNEKVIAGYYYLAAPDN